MAKSKDLFDDNTMSFGEHLEALRVHLWKSIIGLVICVIAALFFGTSVVSVIRSPLDAALTKYGLATQDDIGHVDVLTHIKAYFGNEEAQEQLQQEEDRREQEAKLSEDASTIVVEINLQAIATALHKADPDRYPKPKAPGSRTQDEPTSATAPEQDEPSNSESEARPVADAVIQVALKSKFFAESAAVKDKQERPITLTVQEAFMTYLKVAFVTGFVMASPWIFYQMWLFVAAGLYDNERKYVYIYLPLSLTLFVGGVLFCFFAVFPFVLDFLLGFNRLIGVIPQIRLSEWISFALMLPLMFGISFQLPIVMLFLERISIFDAAVYREKRRMAILVIAVLSMFLTPADPASMLLMMIPLVALYELGILMCGFVAAKSPFETETA